jgi:hypothetical protein
MTDFPLSDEPDWTRRCKGSDLMRLAGCPCMLRESEGAHSHWRHVASISHEGFSDPETGLSFAGMSVEFHGGGERVINESDDIEIGFIRPPWWTDDVEPPEWPRPLPRSPG